MHFDDIYARRNTLHLFRDIGARLSREERREERGREGEREGERERERGNAVAGKRSEFKKNTGKSTCILTSTTASFV